VAKRGRVPPVERIAETIVLLRGQRVIVDKELAALYGVTTKRLNEQVKRNPGRFPGDFMFQLGPEDASALRSQIGDGSRFSVDGMTVAHNGWSQPD
jgi:hypothetical protein